MTVPPRAPSVPPTVTPCPWGTHRALAKSPAQMPVPPCPPPYKEGHGAGHAGWEVPR